MSMFYGAVRQVGYVVRDIEKTMEEWVRLGVGPWFYSEDVVSTSYRYYGATQAPPKLSIALANSGGLQIELIQQRDDTPSLYRDSLLRNGEVAQHVAYWTADRFADICRQLLESGHIEGHAGQMGAGMGPYAYFVHPDHPSVMIEVSDTSGGKAQLFELIQKAALVWDGTDPIRRIGANR